MQHEYLIPSAAVNQHNLNRALESCWEANRRDSGFELDYHNFIGYSRSDRSAYTPYTIPAYIACPKSSGRTHNIISSKHCNRKAPALQGTSFKSISVYIPYSRLDLYHHESWLITSRVALSILTPPSLAVVGF